jgi:hypothetical protein
MASDDLDEIQLTTVYNGDGEQYDLDLGLDDMITINCGTQVEFDWDNITLDNAFDDGFKVTRKDGSQIHVTSEQLESMLEFMDFFNNYMSHDTALKQQFAEYRIQKVLEGKK